jgi:hypothetical protein
MKLDKNILNLKLAKKIGTASFVGLFTEDFSFAFRNSEDLSVFSKKLIDLKITHTITPMGDLINVSKSYVSSLIDWVKDVDLEE